MDYSMEMKEVETDKKRYLDLLLLADEQEDMIDRYLERGTMLWIFSSITRYSLPTYADNSCHPFMAIQHSFKKSGPYPTFG